MRKIILSLAVILMVVSANAQSKFEVKDFGDFKLHSYVTADPLGDMSYIIEGQKGLVVVEPAVFIEKIKEFGAYVATLNKPVEKVISNYHAAGFSGFDHSKFVMVEGMPEFIQGDVYKGMMQNFAAGFGKAIDVSDFVPTITVGKNSREVWAGIEFRFSPGISTDFPAASILIGGKVYYMHFTPVANMHMSAMQIPSREAIDGTLAELERAKASGATTYIGGHGVATASIDAIDFQIDYLKKVKETISLIKTGDEFIMVMQMSYPNIAAEANLTALASNLYK